MKTLLTIFTLVFTVMFSSTSFAGWTKVSTNVNGDTFYVDFERIRKHGGYVYWWDLSDYLKPNDVGGLSEKNYNQGDCKLFRYMFLHASLHKEPMGGGPPLDVKVTNLQKWRYPSPYSMSESILKKVCSR